LIDEGSVQLRSMCISLYDDFYNQNLTHLFHLVKSFHIMFIRLGCMLSLRKFICTVLSCNHTQWLSSNMWAYDYSIYAFISFMHVILHNSPRSQLGATIESEGGEW